MSYPSTIQGDPFWPEDLAEAQSNASNFEEPADTVAYEDYRYVGAHNAFSYPRFFETVRQQDQTIIGQLAFGVRGLMLDTYDWAKRDQTAIPIAERLGPGDVVLSHPDLGAVSRLQKGHGSYQTLGYELRRVIEFLKANPKAVVTIILEDYADRLTTAAEIKQSISAAGLAHDDDLIFRPADFVTNNGFPNLGWMRTNNRRLVIFTQNGADTDVTFSQFDYCYENEYGTSDDTELCTERPESARSTATDRRLVVFNHFPGPGQGSGVTPTVAMQKWRVQFETAETIIAKAKAAGFANGRLPNGYWADRVIDCVNQLKADEESSIFDYVNKLNGMGGEQIHAGKPYFFRLAGVPDRHLSKCHQTHAGGTYYGWDMGDDCQHRLEYAKSTPSHFLHFFKSGDHVYLKTTEADMKGYVYLNADNYKNLYYNDNTGGDEEWIIERVDSAIRGFLRVGETVRLKSVRQTKDAGDGRYLSAESDGYLATRSIADGDSRNLGIDWILED